MNHPKEQSIAGILLEIEAVKLDPVNLFTWTSGIQSPIYCDNRQIISYPKHRQHVTKKFCERISSLGEVELIAGTATAGIPWAAWIAQELGLPMVYVRGGAKGHGLKNAIEGHFTTGQKTVLIEDLVSTGKSSVEALSKLKDLGLNVIEVQSIFTYDFQKAKDNFEKHEIAHFSLTNLEQLINTALSKGLLSAQQIGIIEQWKQERDRD